MWPVFAAEEHMRMHRWGLLAIASLVFAAPLLAHHGTATYEVTKTASIKGTVTDFQFINPHVLIFFEARDEKGSVEQWQGELTSPNHLARAGWAKHTLKPGDQVTFGGFRAKSGAPTLWITKIVTADGQEIPLAPGD
jgi:hypothetical protein